MDKNCIVYRKGKLGISSVLGGYHILEIVTGQGYYIQWPILYGKLENAIKAIRKEVLQ